MDEPNVVVQYFGAKLLKRASFTSVADLQARVLAFVEYFNTTMAKP